MSSIRLKAAAPASFAVTVAERWCYPAGTSLPSNPDLPHLPCRHQPTRASKAAEPQTSASLVCSQYTVCNRGADISICASSSHFSHGPAARTGTHTPAPTAMPCLTLQRGNPKHRIALFSLLFHSVVFPIEQSHTQRLRTLRSPVPWSDPTACLHCAVSAPRPCRWHKPQGQCRGEVTSL